MKTIIQLIFAGLLVILGVESAPPTCEQILNTYIDGLGGREALLKVNDRLYSGTLTWLFSDRDPSQVIMPAQVFSSGTGRWRLFLDTSKGSQGMGYDGKDGWVQNADRIYRDKNQKTSNLAFLFNAHAPLHLSDYFPDLGQVSKETIENRIVYKLESHASEKNRNYLIFDAQTGLLVQIGDNYKLSEYREVQGLTLPFRIEVIRGKNKAIYTFDKIEHNLDFAPEKTGRPSADQVFPDAFADLTESRVLPLLIDFPSGHEDMNIPSRDGRFLYDLICSHNYKRGLEIGTFTGYSALWFGLAFQRTGGTLVTLEIDQKPGEEAQRNIQRAGLDTVVDARITDAFAEIPKLPGDFDFVFIDAWKPDYMQFLKLLRDRVVPGGVIVAHNVTNYARDMQDFLKTIKEDPMLETSLQEISAEGMSVSFVLDSNSVNEDRYKQNTLPLYPETLEKRPDIPSPYTDDGGTEIILAYLKDTSFALIPVTVENGSPLLYSYKIPSLYGKDSQLSVSGGDFPALAKTGLHSEAELDKKERITGIPISLITLIGRPDGFSYAGFMAEDEDIISVLKGDNRQVRALGMTHSDMARPLFHVWNIILKEIELGRLARFWNNIPAIHYNGRKIFLTAMAMKGWQDSIFHDDVRGRHDLSVRCELTPDEKAYLKTRYSHLSGGQMRELEEKLCYINFSEMVPFYIMRYGFYEGHTDYRADPIAIAFIFGLKSLVEIEAVFPGRLHEMLTAHFTRN